MCVHRRPVTLLTAARESDLRWGYVEAHLLKLARTYVDFFKCLNSNAENAFIFVVSTTRLSIAVLLSSN